MAKHKEISVISSHTKKVFANIRRQGHGFSRNVTPLFKTMMVNAQEEVEEAKTGQAKEIANLKKRVKKLEKRRKSRPAGLRRLKKVGLSNRVESSKEKDSLGAQEDASKQERSIEDIDQDEKLHYQAKVISTATTTVTTAITSSRAKGIVFHEQVQEHIPTVSSSKDKGKEKMIEPVKPLKKKDQIALDEEVAKRLEAEMKAEIEEEERIKREKDKANRAMIEE
nr:hypothetical protein [Tanacetum cinerariifolium]